MKLVTAEQMRALEQRADVAANTFAQMMERAGQAVAAALTAHLAAQGRRARGVLVLVGPGNNGGDGLVCARYLADAGIPVALYLWKRAGKDEDANYRLCLERHIPVTHAEGDPQFAALSELLARHDVIVDALLGTGVTRPVEGLLKEVLAAVRAEIDKRVPPSLAPLVPTAATPPRAHPLVVAVDLPSGLNPDTGALDPATLPADLTVTFAFPKVGQLLYPGAGAVGALVVADIGIPVEWAADIRIEAADAAHVAAQLPPRPQNSHKGTYGKAMICAGSANYVGAAFLAASACTREGTGLVSLALARTIQPMVAAACHEATYVPLPDEEGALTAAAVPVLLGALAGYDALLVGPGFGRHAGTIEFVRRLLGTRRELPPLVIDADALYALAQTPDWWTALAPGRAILTPHPGEMATLSGLATSAIQTDRIRVATRFAAQWQQIVILKGAHTVVAAPDGRVTIVPIATPALATAGTGDVLAGSITGLLAQKLEPYAAAVVGSYLHGLAGLLAEREIGRAGAVAGDLLPRLPAVMQRLRGE